MSETFTDTRDGQTYKTVRLNGKIWMAENLKFVAFDSYIYDDDHAKGHKYGRLYTFGALQSACPPGWRLPRWEEVDDLIKAFSALNVSAYQCLIDGGDSGFNAVLGGSRNRRGDYVDLGMYTRYWTALHNRALCTFDFYLRHQAVGKYISDIREKSGFYVRCIKDA